MKKVSCPNCGREIFEALMKSHLQNCRPQGETERVALGNGLYVPEADPHFVIPKGVRETLELVERLSSKHPVNVLITGAQGCGKTSLARQFASRFNRPFTSVECGFLQEPQQWFGRLDLRDGKTVYLESAFIRGVETPRAVVCLDEMNRVENEKVLNVLMAFLDERRRAYVDDIQRIVKVADGVVFFATLNEGAMFAGIDRVDAALRDRFREISLDYLPPNVESEVLVKKTGVSGKDAHTLAQFAASVREDKRIERKVSIRQLLMMAEDIALGLPIRQAVLTAIGYNYDRAWQQQILEHLHTFLPVSEVEGVDALEDYEPF